MAQTKQKLRLVLSPKTFCDAMVHANIALSEGNLEEAIDHYTKVLHKLAPGLTCAFLNRCMAYLHSGYYELAVMDAYRACITARGLFKVRLYVVATSHTRLISVVRSSLLSGLFQSSYSLSLNGRFCPVLFPSLV